MKLVSKGNPLFVCNVRDLNNKVKDIPEDIEVVNEFLDVFVIPRIFLYFINIFYYIYKVFL